MRAGKVDRRAIVAGVLTVLAALALAASAAASPHVAGRTSATAARPTFRPRVGFALGLLPLHGAQEIATSPSIPVLYHGGAVMRNVTIHTIFWAPAGYRYDGSPGAGALGLCAAHPAVLR